MQAQKVDQEAAVELKPEVVGPRKEVVVGLDLLPSRIVRGRDGSWKHCHIQQHCSSKLCGGRDVPVGAGDICLSVVCHWLGGCVRDIQRCEQTQD